jgi:hypothetical protein
VDSVIAGAKNSAGPGEIAVAFLASEMASYLEVEMLNVKGGELPWG